MKGVAPNISSTLATGARPRARMKLTKLPASSTALASNAQPAFRTSIDAPRRWRTRNGNIVATRNADRQNDTSHAGSSMRRTMTPAVLKIVAAATARTTPSAATELREVARVFMARSCEYGFDVPPSIDSLDLPPFRPRFPWWSADLQTIAALLGTYQADLPPPSACAFAWQIAAATFW